MATESPTYIAGLLRFIPKLFLFGFPTLFMTIRSNKQTNKKGADSFAFF